MVKETSQTRPLVREDIPESAGTPSLEVVKGPGRGRRRPLLVGATVIGRGMETDFRLEADGVSRKHAKVLVAHDGAVSLVDLGSTNGTFLNGRRIEMAVLREGDRIELGQGVLRFARGDGSAVEAPPAADPLVGLSAREREVAELVAEGLTNNEVAEKLHISPRTVSTHLANVYEKLDIPNRAALAKLVGQR